MPLIAGLNKMFARINTLTFRSDLLKIIQADPELAEDPKAEALIADLKVAGLYGDATEDEIERFMDLGE